MKPILILLALAIPFALPTTSPAQGESEGQGVSQGEGDFSRSTIDLGVVVGDLEASATFYGKVLGFQELDGFSVPESFCSAAGLTEGHPLTIRVFALGEDEAATKLKLMELPGVESKAGDHAFIHSQLGFSYLTVYVNDLTASLARLERAGQAPLGTGPVLIGEDPAGSWLALVSDPDGNLVELIGPKP